jgi:hypothetical protein
MVALAGVAAFPKSVAFVGDVAAPEGPETQIAAASAKAAKAARMISAKTAPRGRLQAFRSSSRRASEFFAS